jgi:hypothetical protein
MIVLAGVWQSLSDWKYFSSVGAGCSIQRVVISVCDLDTSGAYWTHVCL